MPLNFCHAARLLGPESPPIGVAGEDQEKLMPRVEIRPKGGDRFTADLDRVPVAGDYVFAQGQLGHVPAVVLREGAPAVVYLRKDPDGIPDEI